MTPTPQPADRMPSSVNQKQADLGATAATKEATQEDREYVVLKRGLFWRPNDQGYTNVFNEAARYTREEAMERCHGGEEPVTMEHVSKYGATQEDRELREFLFGLHGYQSGLTGLDLCDLDVRRLKAHVARATERLREELNRSTYESAKLFKELNNELIDMSVRASKAEADLATLSHERDEWKELARKRAYESALFEGGRDALREERDELRKALEDIRANAEGYSGFWSRERARIALNADSRPASVPKEAIDSALTRHEGREGQQKSDPVGTQDGVKGEGWRDMETAPKDGSIVLVAIPRRAEAETAQMRPSGLWKLCNGGHTVKPSSWMPLPATPQASLRNPTQGQP